MQGVPSYAQENENLFEVNKRITFAALFALSLFSEENSVEKRNDVY